MKHSGAGCFVCGNRVIARAHEPDCPPYITINLTRPPSGITGYVTLHVDCFAGAAGKEYMDALNESLEARAQRNQEGIKSIADWSKVLPGLFK